MNERSIFENALQIDSPADRLTYLDQACGDDAGLRQRMENLIAAQAGLGSFMEHPAVEPLATEVASPSDAEPPRLQGSAAEAQPLSFEFLEAADDPDCLGTLGQYEVLELIGRGGMGLVFKARDRKLDRIVALKVLAPEIASIPSARKRFLREAQTAGSISHDHIVRIYAVEEGACPYLVMECIDGKSLQQRIDEEGQLELRESLRIARQVAAGLAAAHELGLIHRDIKPSNILLQNGIERVQITDFGLARAVADVDITRTGETAGTPQYMSPEQAQGLPVDARSDLFSLGSVRYAMCAGRSPFRADTGYASLKRVCDDEPRPLHEIAPETPEWLNAIIVRLLMKNPDDRFQSAREVADLLGAHLARVQDSLAAPLPLTIAQVSGKAIRGQERAHRWVLPAGLLIGLLGIVGMTEATGLTRFTGSVIRLVTGEGTLVIEVDDPTVEISLDGEELRITGAGLKEIKLRPGQYQFQASKDGKPLKSELVSITRNGRKALRVTREAGPSAARVLTKNELIDLAHQLADEEKWPEAIAAWVKANKTPSTGEMHPYGYAMYLITMHLKTGNNPNAKLIIDKEYQASYAARDESSLWWIFTLYFGQLGRHPVDPPPEFLELLANRWTQDEVRERAWNDNLYSLALGIWEYRQGNYKRALEYLQWDVESVEHQRAVRQLFESMAYAQSGDLELARTAYQRAIQTQTLNVPPRRTKVYAAEVFKPLWFAWAIYDIAHEQARNLLIDRGIKLNEVDAQAMLRSQPFVVRNGDNKEFGKYNTLVDAVAGANPGDTIEIRGNGPFVCNPIRLTHALTIRAGAGFRPVLQIQGNIYTNCPLVLEGLEFEPLGEKIGPGFDGAMVFTQFSNSLHVGNCRFREHRTNLPCVVANARDLSVRNCEFLCATQTAIAGNVPPAKQWVIENCVATTNWAGILTLFNFTRPVEPDTCIRLKRNTVVSQNGFNFYVNREQQEAEGQDHRILVESSGNIFSVEILMLFVSTDKALQPSEAESLLRKKLAWHEDRNLVFPGSSGICVVAPEDQERFFLSPKNPTEWNTFWQLGETNSTEGRPRFKGGDLRARLMATPERITAEDYRLRPDSPGYWAGKDGKDLGADIDLVGPGLGYERWKQTPAYQQWLKETGQVKTPE